jgi:hypothetical protein
VPILTDPKKEKFAHLCARGSSTIDAYERAGYKRNTGNATAFRKRPDIVKRIEELQIQLQAQTEEDLQTYLAESHLTPTHIIKQMKENADLASAAGKHDVAAKILKDLGSELFGMFTEHKHISVDQKSVHTTTTTTINLTELDQALKGLAGQGPSIPQIDGVAERIEPDRAAVAPIAIEHDRG